MSGADASNIDFSMSLALSLDPAPSVGGAGGAGMNFRGLNLATGLGLVSPAAG